MRLFDTLEAAERELAGDTKWDRAFQAIALADSLPAGVAYSVGDTLTWRLLTADDADAHAIKRRRYARVLFCKEGSARIDHAEAGRTHRPYSDLDDREEVELGSEDEEGVASTTIEPGQLICFAINEASRIRPAAGFSGVLLNVTVEGRSFANK
ncbi:hypothetical protein [Schaalia hyovaginalis]|uniref:hypothetical protein n=1 Tax=Schaalia hyovaginalis TaxID=29316 RepID=UPI001F44AF80|nr:hypothetical protein [Schaalia hyovaginalis]MCF2711233.1 hypothetical protein [Schaalia hyovaginalis]